MHYIDAMSAGSPTSQPGATVPFRACAGSIFGESEMAGLVRDLDWAATPLGPMESWSETLLSHVNLLLSSPLPTTLCWGDRLTFFYNDAAIPTLGEMHPALGRSYRDVFAEAWPLVGPDMEAALYAGQSPVRENIRIPLLRQGRIRDGYYTYALVPVRENDRIVGVFNPYQETTAAVLATRDLRASEARANRVLQSIGDAVIVTDDRQSITQMNLLAQQLTGWGEAEARGRPLSPTGARLGVSGSATEHAVLHSASGRTLEIDSTTAPIHDESGKLSGGVVVFRDVTEIRRRQREAADVAASQRFLLHLSDRQSAATGAREIMQIAAEELARHLDVDRVGYSEATPDMQRMVFETGWAQRDLQTLSGSVPMDHWSDDTSADFARGRTVVYHDVRLVPNLAAEVANYEAIGARAVVAAPFLRGGTWRGSLYVNHPRPRHWQPHEVKLVEEVARRTADAVERAHSEAQLNHFLNATRDLIVAVDRDWRISFLNAAAQAFYAQGRDLVGKHLWAEFPDAAQPGSPFVEHYERAMHQGIAGSFEASLSAPLDVHIQLEVYPTPAGIVTFSRDITAQRRAEAAVMQSEKLAAVGRLAASIAHEINNPLESVTNLLYLARNSSAHDEIQQYLAIAERELRRVSAISNQTLRFYKQSTGARPVPADELINGVLSVFQGRLVNSGVAVERRRRSRTPVACYEGEIRQVLSNLVGNAIDAMQPAGGRLLIRDRDACDRRTGREGVAITIADQGSGIPPAILHRIFDAFYTTKGIGGTGLGLWVSKEILDRHQGRLLVRSSQQPHRHGTVFTVFLPFQAAAR